MQSSACQLLLWDSSFFALKIARFTPTRMTPDSALTAFEWCRSNEIDCLYFLAEPDDRETVRVAEVSGFELVDIRVNLVRRTSGESVGEPDSTVRLFEHGDLAQLKAIARQSHRDSRFFFDGRFPEKRCEDLFETLIERSCQGWAQAVFVTDVDGVASGYCTCHAGKDARGSIGLVALAEHARGRMLGLSLISAGTAYFRGSGIEHVSVVTQGRNCRAQRLYQRCGFVTDSVMLWYHKWFRTPGSGAGKTQ